MNSTTLQRVARRLSTLVIGIVGMVCLSTSVGNAQSVIQITNWDGTVLPAHAHLYTMFKHCAPSGPVTVCDWYVRKLYGDNYAVIVAVHTGGVDPACNGGFTVHQLSGYSRSGCLVYVSTAVYGVN